VADGSNWGIDMKAGEDYIISFPITDGWMWECVAVDDAGETIYSVSSHSGFNIYKHNRYATNDALPATAAFDLNDNGLNHKALTYTLPDNLGDLLYVSNNLNIVGGSVAYTLNADKTVTIAAAALDTYTVGTTYTLTFQFSSGIYVTSRLIVTDTTSTDAQRSPVAVDNAGNMYHVLFNQHEVLETPVSTGTQWGVDMTAGKTYIVAGSSSSGYVGDGTPSMIESEFCYAEGVNRDETGEVIQPKLLHPTKAACDPDGNLYILEGSSTSDGLSSHRIREVAAKDGVQWGVSMKAGNIYTIVGTGASGSSPADGAVPTETAISMKDMIVDNDGNIFFCTLRGSVYMIPVASGTYYGKPMEAGKIYAVTGDCHAYYIAVGKDGDIYIAHSPDVGFLSDYIQVFAASDHTRYGINMTAGNLYTIGGMTHVSEGTAWRWSGTGSGTIGDIATNVGIGSIYGIAVDADANVYISSNNGKDYISAVNMIAGKDGPQWGQNMTAGHLYTVSGISKKVDGDTAFIMTSVDGLAVTSDGSLYAGVYNYSDFSSVTYLEKPSDGISLSQTTAYTFTGQTTGYSALTPLSITVTNTGNQATGALTAALSGTNSGSFTLSKTSISSIAAGGTDSFTVEPNTGLSAGTYIATVTVSGSNVTSQTFDVSFTVNAASTYGITLSQTAAYTFTEQTTGYSALTPLSITVTNTGSLATGALTAALSGTNASSFTLSMTAISSIAAGGTDSFTVVPSTGLSEGTYTATVTVSGSNVTSQTFGVSFTVSAASTYGISLSQTTAYTFPAQITDYSALTPLSVTVTNTGSQAMGVLTAALSGTNASSFTLSRTAISSIAAGDTGSFTIVPNTGLLAGTYTAAVTVSGSNVTSQSFTVSFTVSAASTYGITLSQTAAYTFTGQTTGYSALTPLSITVTNTGSQATGALNAALSGTNASSFTLYKTSISSIAAGGMGSFTVVPNTGLSAGTYKAAVTVSGSNVTSHFFTVSFTVSNGSTGSDSGSGSGSSSSSDNNITVTTENNTTIASQTFTASTGSNGIASASVTSSQISEMLTAASEKATGTNAQTTLTIQVEVGNGATGVSVTIPKTAVSSLKGGEVSLTVSSSVATVTLDSATLSEIGKQTNGDVKITATTADTSALSDESKSAIGTRPVYDLKITSGNTTVSSFGGGIATVSVPYTPASGEDENAIVVYYINASGTLVMVPNCVYEAKTGTVTFITTHFSTYAVGYNAVSFTDVSNSAWYADYVTYLAARGIVGGKNGAFSPDASITRAEFVTILSRMSGDDLSGYTSSSFADVFTDNWYFAAVQWAYKNGVASGSKGKFNPNASITREQMAAMLYRYTEYEGMVSNTEGMSVREFTDYDNISSWAQAPIQWAINNGIVSGNSDGTFAPMASATRAEAAKMIALLLKDMIGS
jgi:hypothetical protein